MRFRALLISSSVVACAAIGAGGASAATLYTTGAHTTQVALNTVAGATNTTPVVLTSATSVLNTCANSTLSLTATQNSGGTVAGTITSGTFTNCSPLPATGTFHWNLIVDGTATTVGDTTFWTARVNNVAFHLGGGLYTGSLTQNVTARQTGAGGNVCLTLDDAGHLSGPLTSNGRIDATYCFEGAAATYSLT